MPEVGEWFGIEPSSFIAELVGVMQGSFPFQRFMNPKNWAQQSPYANRYASDFEKAL